MNGFQDEFEQKYKSEKMELMSAYLEKELAKAKVNQFLDANIKESGPVKQEQLEGINQRAKKNFLDYLEENQGENSYSNDDLKNLYKLFEHREIMAHYKLDGIPEASKSIEECLEEMRVSRQLMIDDI